MRFLQDSSCHALCSHWKADVLELLLQQQIQASLPPRELCSFEASGRARLPPEMLWEQRMSGLSLDDQ